MENNLNLAEVLNNKEELLHIESEKEQLKQGVIRSKYKISFQLLVPFLVLTLMRVVLNNYNIDILSMGNLLEILMLVYVYCIVYPEMKKIKRTEKSNQKIVTDELEKLDVATQLFGDVENPEEVDLGLLVELSESIFAKHDNVIVYIKDSGNPTYVSRYAGFNNLLFQDMDTKEYFQACYLDGKYFEYMVNEEEGVIVPV